MSLGKRKSRKGTFNVSIKSVGSLKPLFDDRKVASARIVGLFGRTAALWKPWAKGYCGRIQMRWLKKGQVHKKKIEKNVENNTMVN